MCATTYKAIQIVSPLCALPSELKVFICSYLPVADLKTIAVVSTEFGSLYKNNSIWKSKLEEHFFSKEEKGLREWAEAYSNSEGFEENISSFLTFVNNQDEKRGLNGFINETKKDRNDKRKQLEILISFAKQHLSQFFKEFDAMYKDEHKFYRVYKNLFLARQKLPPSMILTFELSNRACLKHYILGGEEFFKKVRHVGDLYTLFCFFKEDPKLGSKIQFSSHYDGKKKRPSSRYPRALFIAFLAGLVGLSIGIYKMRKIAKPAFIAKL